METIDSAFASYRKETDARLDALQQELVNVKISANNRDQLLRMKSVKVSGFPVSEEERSASDPEKFLAKRIYDKILVPILTAAKEDGALDSVPTLTKTIEVIRRINTWSPPSTSGSVPGLAPKEKAPPPRHCHSLLSSHQACLTTLQEGQHAVTLLCRPVPGDQRLLHHPPHCKASSRSSCR